MHFSYAMQSARMLTSRIEVYPDRSLSCFLLPRMFRELAESYPLEQADQEAGQCKYKHKNLNLLFRIQFGLRECAVKYF